MGGFLLNYGIYSPILWYFPITYADMQCFFFFFYSLWYAVWWVIAVGCYGYWGDAITLWYTGFGAVSGGDVYCIPKDTLWLDAMTYTHGKVLPLRIVPK